MIDDNQLVCCNNYRTSVDFLGQHDPCSYNLTNNQLNIYMYMRIYHKSVFY